jgi:hypothetical protein
MGSGGECHEEVQGRECAKKRFFFFLATEFLLKASRKSQGSSVRDRLVISLGSPTSENL